MKAEIDIAIDLLKAYKLEDAQIAFEKILENNPKDIDSLVHLGKIHSRTQNYGVALNYYNKVIDIEPDNADAKTGLVLVNNILQLINNFYFENAYTDDDLYE